MSDSASASRGFQSQQQHACTSMHARMVNSKQGKTETAVDYEKALAAVSLYRFMDPGKSFCSDQLASNVHTFHCRRGRFAKLHTTLGAAVLSVLLLLNIIILMYSKWDSFIDALYVCCMQTGGDGPLFPLWQLGMVYAEDTQMAWMAKKYEGKKMWRTYPHMDAPYAWNSLPEIQHCASIKFST